MNKENILKLIESKKLQKYIDLKKENLEAYNTAFEDKWLHELPLTGEIGRNYWNPSALEKVAKSFTNKRDFKSKFPGPYTKAQKLGILQDICSHMNSLGSLKQRYLYAFEFSDKSVYVGLSHDPDKRYREHLTKHKGIIEKTAEIGHTFYVFDQLIPYDLVGDAENDLIEEYRSEGWKLLNKAKGGGLGGRGQLVKWTKEAIIEEVQKYQTRSEFRANARGAYKAARRYGILDEVNSYLKPRNNWTKENIQKEALKYNNLKDFDKASRPAVIKARKLGILKEVTSHMEDFYKTWNYSSAEKEAKKYKTRSKFNKNNHSAYYWLYKKNLLDKACSHMDSKKSWNKSKVKKEALMYSSRTDFFKGSVSAYEWAKRNKVLDEICSHMKKYIPPSKWNKENLKIESDKYDKRSHFQKENGAAYNAALRLNLLDKLFPGVKKKINWDSDKIKSEARKYKNSSEFRNGCKDAYIAAYKRGLLPKLFKDYDFTSPGFWSEENIRLEAEKYSSIGEFSKGAGGAYDAARKLNLLDELFDRKKVYWNEELIREKARLCKDRKEFSEKYSGAIRKARSLGILDELFPIGHINWNEDLVRAEALKYKFRKDFNKESSGAYKYALKHNLLDDICSHMKTPEKKIKWTKEAIIEEAKKYKNRSELKKKAKGAYVVALKNKMLDDLFPK